MRVSEEPNVELLRENLTLKGMTADQVALNLPGLLAKASGSLPSKLTKPGSEQRERAQGDGQPKKPQVGHGPTAQPKLPVINETFDLDEADKTCPRCGGELEEWEGQEDETQVIAIIERQWVVRHAKLKKYRCDCGDCIETADAPTQLIKGGHRP